MATRDPFQKNFSTVEELLSNPRGGVRSNPSKAYETIVKAVKDSGGWIQQKMKGRYVYGVLAGPLTGTYTLGARLNIYRPSFDFGVSRTKMPGLYKFQFNRLMAKLGPLYEVVKQLQLAAAIKDHEQALLQDVAAGVELLVPRERALLDFERIEGGYWSVHQMRSWLEEVAQAARYDEEGSVGSAERQLARFNRDPHGYTQQFNKNLIPSRIQETTAFIHAVELYVMSQAGGIPVERVIADLKEKPKRLLSLRDVNIPTRLSDRTRYSNEFLRTWSPGKAFKRIIPNVEGTIKLDTGWWPRPEDVRDVLSGVPSWRQLAARTDNPFDVEGHETPQQAAEVHVTRWLGLMIREMQDLKKLGVTPKVFREQLLRRYTHPQLTLLRDAMMMIDAGESVLAETPEGRLLIRARAERDWPRILRGHDMAMGAAKEAEERSAAKSREERLARGEAFKRGAEQFSFPPGVRPLITEPEYACEGSEMEHCVHTMKYYMSEAGYEFAFTAPDGTRATLELSKDGTVRQFFGPKDSTPSAATRALLNTFLRLNADNIVRMQKGAFPVYAKSNRGPRRRSRA